MYCSMLFLLGRPMRTFLKGLCIRFVCSSAHSGMENDPDSGYLLRKRPHV